MINPLKNIEKGMMREYSYSLLFHYLGYMFMQTLAVLGEGVRGPTLPDRLHEWIEPRREFAIWNNQIWIFELFFVLILFSIFRRREAINYLRVGGLVSIIRGVFIFLTSLGPTDIFSNSQFIPDMSLTPEYLLNFYIPIGGIFFGEKTVFYLTQDLFFSGHTASTFLFLLIYDGTANSIFFHRHGDKSTVFLQNNSHKQRFFRNSIYKKIDYIFILLLLFHLQTVFFLILTHEHYSIDILGAYFIVYAIYKFMRERNLLLN